MTKTEDCHFSNHLHANGYEIQMVIPRLQLIFLCFQKTNKNSHKKDAISNINTLWICEIL